MSVPGVLVTGTRRLPSGRVEVAWTRVADGRRGTIVVESENATGANLDAVLEHAAANMAAAPPRQ